MRNIYSLLHNLNVKKIHQKKPQRLWPIEEVDGISSTKITEEYINYVQEVRARLRPDLVEKYGYELR